MARKPVKITLPGPMTIIGSTASRFIPCQSAIVESSITKLTSIFSRRCPHLLNKSLFNGLIADVFYKNEQELSLDLVKCLNREIRSLSEAGCVYIQVDEPLIARKPEKALEYGIDHLKMCFEVIGL